MLYYNVQLACRQGGWVMSSETMTLKFQSLELHVISNCLRALIARRHTMDEIHAQPELVISNFGTVKILIISKYLSFCGNFLTNWKPLHISKILDLHKFVFRYCNFHNTCQVKLAHQSKQLSMWYKKNSLHVTELSRLPNSI